MMSKGKPAEFWQAPPVEPQVGVVYEDVVGAEEEEKSSSKDLRNAAKRPRPPPPVIPDDPRTLCIFTDGACSNNGKAQSAAGIGVYFGKDDPRNVSTPVPSHFPQTNQTAELLALEIAVSAACEAILSGQYINAKIYTDSAYSLNCVTVWVHNWERNGWYTSTRGVVKYKEVIQGIVQNLRRVDKIELIKVKGHDGIEGNEQADRLARNAVSRIQAAEAESATKPEPLVNASPPPKPEPPRFVIFHGRRYELVTPEECE
jgi:ribonuclease HI